MVENNSKNLKQKNNSSSNNSPWFIAVVFLCIAVLILSGIVFYVIKPHRSEIIMNKIFTTEERDERLHIICIDDEITLREIAEETHMSYEELYESMNIPSGTDPDIPICELMKELHAHD